MSSKLLACSLTLLSACIVPNPFAIDEAATGAATEDESESGDGDGDGDTGTTSDTSTDTTDTTDTTEPCEAGALALLEQACPSEARWRLLGVCDEQGMEVVATEVCVDPLLADCDPASAPFGGGVGTAEDPYLICTSARLQAVGAEASAHFALTRALELGTLNDADALGFIATDFSGDFDGRGHLLRASLRQSAVSGTGLFATIGPGATVHDLNLVGDFESTGTGSMLASTVTGATLERINLNLGVSSASSDNAGGAVRMLGPGSSMQEVRGYGALTVARFSGGLVGTLEGQATRLRFDGSIAGVQKVGGITGDVRGDALLAEAHSLAAVSVSNNRGGCISATATDNASLRDLACEGEVAGAYVSGGAVEAFECSGCTIQRALIRVAYSDSATNRGGETTSLGGNDWDGGDVLLVDLPINVFTAFGAHVAAAELVPASPAVAAFEAEPAWSFDSGTLELAWDLDPGGPSCSPDASPLVSCLGAIEGLRLCLPGGVEITDCLIDLDG